MLKAGATTAMLALFLAGCAQSGGNHFSLSDYRSGALASSHHVSPYEGLSRTLVTIERGDTLLKVIERAGGASSFFYSMTRSQQARMSQMHPGDIYEVMVNKEGQVVRLARQMQNGKWLAAEGAGGNIIMSEQDMVSQYREHLISGTLGFDLRRDLVQMGLPETVILEALEVMSAQVDIRETYHPGDTVRVIYRQPMLDGEKAGSPHVKSIQYVNQGDSYFAFRHQTRNGVVGYYDERGRGLGSEWMKKPIQSYTRISSEFNPRRRHPVTGRVRPHNGVDFAAPPGTPIYAASDGIVSVAGRNGGFGIYVAIEHPGKIETRYAHMSRLGSIRAGDRVTKGDVIGYVGTTGLSTGPHLHYEMWVNGVARDPLREGFDMAQNQSLDGSELRRFIASRDRMRPLMERGREYVAIHNAGSSRG